MKNFVATMLLATTALLILGGCHGGSSLPAFNAEESKKQIADTKELETFMAANPDVGDAKMDSIYATGRSSVNGDFVLSPRSEFDTTATLDQTKAKQAVTLFDKVTNHPIMSQMVGVMFRLIAVTINIEKANGANFEGMPNMSCDEMINDPGQFVEKASNGQMTSAKFKEFVEGADKKFNDKIQKCSEIDGKGFAKCMKTLALTIAAVHQKVTCSLKSESELEKALENTEESIDKKAMEECNALLAQCGIDADFMESMGNPDENGDDNGVAEQGEGHGGKAKPKKGGKKTGGKEKAHAGHGHGGAAPAVKHP